MPNDMGTFRVDIEVEDLARPGQKRALRSNLFSLILKTRTKLSS